MSLSVAEVGANGAKECSIRYIVVSCFIRVLKIVTESLNGGGKRALEDTVAVFHLHVFMSRVLMYCKVLLGLLPFDDHRLSL